MNKKQMRLFILLTTSLVILLFAAFLVFTVIPTHKGVIVEVLHNEETGQSSIWVVEGISADINNKSKEELAERYKYQGIIFKLPSYLPDRVKKDLFAGQEVKIYINGTIQESGPGGGKAYWVTADHKEE
ncbi:hypothetical protein SAMN05421503_3421 [Terribacillus aidingensis]|uniref:DUF3221 domain-containing protein n=1 Tax=Terribacillus aidingensis TaxID=586416 RepID=A0A285P899_9BACI|nr:DUF3221 domain-containing protein [Terribacillus aidingensis]SNZ17969.1 hypothetical protein SAMN05421503_3421 [Terribacillus aidingensis]